MKIFEVTEERLGIDSKKFTTLLVVLFIAFPVLLIVLMMHQNPLFDLSEGFSRQKVLWRSTQNVPELDHKNDSSQPPNIPEDVLHGGLLVPKFGKGNDSSQLTSMANDSEIDSSQLSSTPDAEKFGGLLAPILGNGSSPKDTTAQPYSIPHDKLVDGPSVPGTNKGSDSMNNSSQPSIVANDKLLNGLLAPGFDERSCLSRYQSFFYHRASPHKPSTYLLSKLRNYENVHKRCGPYAKSFDQALKRLQFNHRSSNKGCKYIVWLGSNGVGNRIVSMVSAFLYALLTSRVLLVDHGTDMSGLFCEPFLNSTWLLPISFPLKKKFGRLRVEHAHSYESMKNNIMNTSNELPPSFVFLTTRYGDYDIDQLFLCDQSQALLRKVPWLIISSDQYFAPSFFLIPSLQQEMSKLFPEKDTVFHHLGRYLIHPSNKVWELVTKFYQTHYTKTVERIGLQIRVFNARKTPFPVVMDQILACVVKKKLLPEVDTRRSLPIQARNQISKAILITSLSPWFYENLSSMYSTRPTVTGELIGVYQPSHEEYQHRGDNAHNMKALAEIYLLSLSDVLVTSAWSTFGYVAQGLGGLKPWFLQKPGQNKIPNPPCKRDVSMEPCFHYPPAHLCEAKAKVDAGAVVPYITHCMDRKWGVKLIKARSKK